MSDHSIDNLLNMPVFTPDVTIRLTKETIQRKEYFDITPLQKYIPEWQVYVKGYRIERFNVVDNNEGMMSPSLVYITASVNQAIKNILIEKRDEGFKLALMSIKNKTSRILDTDEGNFDYLILE